MRLYAGLKTRILALLVGGLALPVILLGVGAYWFLNTYETTRRMERYLADIALATTRQIDSLLGRAAAAARTTAVDGAIVAALEDEGSGIGEQVLVEHLNVLVERQEILELIVVVDRRGRLVAMNDRVPEGADWAPVIPPGLLGTDLRRLEGEWVDAVLAGTLNTQDLFKVNRAQSSLTEVLGAHDSEDRAFQYFVRYAAPVWSGGEIVGGVCVFLPWHEVQVEIMDRVRDDFDKAGYESGYAFMFDTDGSTIIGHDNREMYDLDAVIDFGTITLFEAVQAREPSHTYEFPPGTDKIAGLARSESEYGFAWNVGTGVNYPDIYDVVRYVGLAYGIAVLTLTVIASTIAVRMTRRFRMSVDRLVETAGLVARGEMPPSVDVDSRDEIGHLAEAFNQMAAALSRRFEEQLSETPFRPIRPNPFIFGNPVKSKEMFFGRQAEFDLARTLLARATGGLVIVFCGERRSGKTSILYQVKSGELGEEFLPIFVDLQAFAASRSEDEFYEALLFEIVDAVRNAEGVGEVTWDRGEGLGAPAFRSFMQGLVREVAPRRIVILFDEYETFDTLIGNGYLSAQTVPFLASFTETDPPVSFIFSGSGSLEEDGAEHWSALFAKSHAIPIGFLQRDDALRLIQEPVAGLVDFDVGVTSGIVRLTGGQPYYTQAICQNLVDHLNRVRQNSCEARDLTAVVDEVVSNPPPQMIYFWRQLNRAEKLTLSLLADLLDKPTAVATPGEVVEQRGQYPEGEQISPLVVQRILDHFVGEEFLERLDGSGYRFRMDLFRLRIRRFHSVWRVLREEVPAE